MRTTTSCLIGASSQVDLFGSSSSRSPFLHFLLRLVAAVAADGLLREKDGVFHRSRPHLAVAPRLTDHGGYENGKPIDENLENGDKCCGLFKAQAGAEIDDSRNTQITMGNFAIAKNSVHQSLAGAI
jgi:hypothetical protein